MIHRPLDPLVATRCRTCGEPSGGPEYYGCLCETSPVVHVTDDGYSTAVAEVVDAMAAAGWVVRRYPAEEPLW